MPLIMYSFADGLKPLDHLMSEQGDLFEGLLGGVIVELQTIGFVVAIVVGDDKAEGLQLLEVDDPLLAFEGEAVEVFLAEGGGLFVGVDG